MKMTPSKEYIEKAKLLTRDEAEQLMARMRGKLDRKLERSKLGPIEAVAIQLEIEDKDLQEWRERWAEIADRETKKQK